MQPVKNALPLPSPSLAPEVRAGTATAPTENRLRLIARDIGELFHAKFEAWITTPEDKNPNIRLNRLPAAALAPDALSLIARREENAQQARDNRR